MFNILLVEDNEMNRDMLTRRLQRKGYSVIIAVDGEGAVRMAQSQAPDLILMDIRLPAEVCQTKTELTDETEYSFKTVREGTGTAVTGI